jgi:hypothetical protein
MTYSLEVKRMTSQIAVDITKQGQWQTYNLEVEREGVMSDCSCNYKKKVRTTYSLERTQRVTCQVAAVAMNEGRDDLQTGGVRCQIVNATAKQGQGRTNWRWRVMCQITVATTDKVQG